MAGQGNRALLALCWIWIAIVIAYMVWGLINQAGLFAWLAELQLRQWGNYQEKLTVTLPSLVLVSPAAWYLRRHALRRQALAASVPDPVAAAGRQRRLAGWFAIAGIAVLATAGGVYAFSQTVPDGSEPPVPFDAATLGAGPVPTGRVQVRGTVDPDVSTGVTETTGGSLERTTFYVGFRADGETDKEAPFRLFIKRSTGTGPPSAYQGFLPEQDGYLFRNGLPGLALRDLQGRGVRVADPYYVLGSGGGVGRRETWYIVASLAGIFGFMLLVVAPAIYFRRARA
jgi:hypothetical protein